MNRVRVDLGERSYDIVAGSGLLKDTGALLGSLGFSSRVVILSNPVVERLYCEEVHNSISAAGFECSRVIIPDGEQYKSYDWSYNILTELLKLRLDRKSCIVALGGGVIGDMAGFVASIYMRGINFVQIPTTLLAQVDSSVGGKTGVNHPLGKNMIGTFHQPRLVIADTDVLKTLDQRQLLCGMAEVIKYGIISDSGLFSYLEDNRDRILGLDESAMTHLIKRSCEIKADVVSRDERESGLREILNYGHTVGHAIETETGYLKYLHGEAVAIGMCLEAKISALSGVLDASHLGRIEGLVKDYGLPHGIPDDIQRNRLIEHMAIDKKTVSGRVKFILPEEIGRVRIETSISDDVILRALA
ncbi:MAG: 3-dehydroquinate synthase [Nitrospiraceae bacterium]|nr:3-dehydroquinate synthase [Nitrospiraceae bacterium]